MQQTAVYVTQEQLFFFLLREKLSKSRNSFRPLKTLRKVLKIIVEDKVRLLP